MPSVTGLLVCAAVLAASCVYGLVHRRRNGRMRVRQKDSEHRLSAGDIGAPLGERATLVQFSSAFCAPCRATRRILADVAQLVDGVSHVEIDAESHLGLVRRLGIVKTPTVLVLDARGTITRRAAGLPRKADVIAALGTVAG